MRTFLWMLAAIALLLGTVAAAAVWSPAGLMDMVARLTAFTSGADKGVDKGKVAPIAPPAAPPAATVTVSQPVSRRIFDQDEYAGRFEAIEQVDVRARVSGYLTEIHFKDGQDVKEGDLLFVLDSRPFERAVDLAKAELEQAKVRVANSSLDVERGKPLLDRQVISEKVYDDRANVMRDAEAVVKVHEARLKSAELELSFTRITAPVTGQVGRTLVSSGNFVTGGTNTATTLARIVSQDPIYFYFDVSEAHAIKYGRMSNAGVSMLGTEVGVALPDEQGFPHQGTLDFLDNRLDEGTGTLKARVTIENPKGLFSAGLFARVRLKGSEVYDALLVADEAIGADQTVRFVWVVKEDGLAERRLVTLGPLYDGLRVVRTGLTANDWVVTKGLHRVRPGQPVTAKREPLAVSDAKRPPDGVLVRTP